VKDKEAATSADSCIFFDNYGLLSSFFPKERLGERIEARPITEKNASSEHATCARHFTRKCEKERP
jgi:hypothetical protein